MYKRCPTSVWVDLLEFNEESRWVVLCEGQDLCTVESEDVVCNTFSCFGGEIRVIDAQVVIEPGHLGFDKRRGDKTTLADEFLDLSTLSVFTLEDGCGVAWSVGGEVPCPL